MQTDPIQTRIETYTASLPTAVQSPNGAQFAFLLSLIASNQEIYRPQAQRVSGEGFALPDMAPSYPDPVQLHTPQVVDRLNHSINDPVPGDYAFLVSRLDVQSRTPRARRSSPIVSSRLHSMPPVIWPGRLRRHARASALRPEGLHTTATCFEPVSRLCGCNTFPNHLHD